MTLADPADRPNAVRLFSVPMAAPDDMSGLSAAMRRGLAAARIAAVFVKTEGNGLDNDWSRPLAARALRAVLGDRGPAAPGDATSAIAEPVIVISGGCEGFITPHMVVVTESAGGLRFGLASSRPLEAHEIGTAAQIEATALAVRQACEQARIEAADVGYAHVVAPWIEPSMPVGSPTVARDAHGSKPYSRGASALGAAVALDGLAFPAAMDALSQHDATVHGSRCAVTAGATGGVVRVMVFANPAGDAGQAGDADPARDQAGALAAAGGQRLGCIVLDDPLRANRALALLPPGHRPVAVLLKGDPPAGGRLRGERLVLAQDSDIHAFRHYRAAMSGVLGAALGSTRLFIGGGAEHQCPPGGALLTLISEPVEAS